MNNNANKQPATDQPINGNGSVTLYQLNETMLTIVRQLETEISLQQSIIRKQLQEIEELKREMGKKEEAALGTAKRLEENLQNVEGNRQLINKLLSDIEHYQNDIDWYKRTYEKRSIWGVIKDKLTRDPDLK
jgi:DNA repair exonuclease SbcCD ATPase subunit